MSNSSESNTKKILTAAEIQERVITIVAEGLGVAKEKITLESQLAGDLGADSLDAVELVMNTEEEFDIQIPDEAAEKLKTVKDIVHYIEMHQKK